MIATAIADHDFFLRRRDLLALGYTDADLRAALEARQIFRVRHGWYSAPYAPPDAVAAVRVGGRLTGRSALLSYGIPVPYPSRQQVVVPAGACRLRRPTDRRARLRGTDGCDIRWLDRTRTALDSVRSTLSIWRVTVAEAILEVLITESRDVAVSCCDLALNEGQISWRELEAVFERAPQRVRRWLALVDGRSQAHGETLVRLWLADAGIRLTPQVKIAGVGRLDGRISARTFVEIDGSQHVEGATLDGSSGRTQFEEDHRRDVLLAVGSKHSLRFTYRQLAVEWPMCLAAAKQAVADDERLARLEALDARIRKRRSDARKRRRERATATRARSSPSFSHGQEAAGSG